MKRRTGKLLLEIRSENPGDASVIPANAGMTAHFPTGFLEVANKRLRLLSVVLVIGSVLIFCDNSFAQVRAGFGYLKLSPGARQFGIAGSLTGALDYTDSFYANPGATGLMREWQWSASYTNWISDIYNASFLYGRQFRTPWSRFTKLVFGVNYLGIPEFDSSEGAVPFVSGSDLLATVSIGQPLSVLSENLSLGANFKYFNSELAEFDATAFALDLGVLYRTPRLNFISPGNGFLDHAILSFGVAATNLGNSVAFLTEKTPLPRTLRTGVALNLGSHDGLQVSLATDYRKGRDEDGFVTFGSELSWSQLVSLRLGYNFEDNLLGHFTFGASLRLDDQLISFKQALPGRNNALRFDLAVNEDSEFSSSPFHGSATHFPIGPESFRIITPRHGARIDSDSLILAWENSLDRDLYDDVNYWLVVDRDSATLAKVLDIADHSSEELFAFLTDSPDLKINQELSETSFLLTDLNGGDFFWTVFAFDRDRHHRFADFGNRHFGRFQVTTAGLRITAIDFDYSPWITEDDYQGTLKITIRNQGESLARNFALSIFDSVSLQLTAKMDEPVATTVDLLDEQPISPVQVGDSVQFEVEWSTALPGIHYIVGKIFNAKTSEPADIKMAEFYTIPKGHFAAPDSVLSQTITNIKYELPYVGKVFFDSSKSKVEKRFVRQWIVEPLLVTLAERLNEHPDFKISLQGTADPNSGENHIALAEARALAVRDTLQGLGVNLAQMEILPGVVLPERKLPKDSNDVIWVLQERRRVDMSADEAEEKILFAPIDRNYNKKSFHPVIFSSGIGGVVPLAEGRLYLQSDRLRDSLDVTDSLAGANLTQTISWQIHETNLNEGKKWQDTQAEYVLIIGDSLGRRFQTRPKSVYLESRITNRERMYFGVAKFALAEPLYGFYWENLLERIPFLLEKPNARLRFIGHACAIGPEPVNLKLSRQRAQVFYDTFLAHVKEKLPELYSEIEKRLDPPEGFGETRPFTFKDASGEDIMLGSNDLPTGRQLNRRVIALIYAQD